MLHVISVNAEQKSVIWMTFQLWGNSQFNHKSLLVLRADKCLGKYSALQQEKVREMSGIVNL